MTQTTFPPLPAEVPTRTVPQLLRAAVDAAPRRTALVAHSLLEGGEVSLDYSELAQRSRRLAGILRDRGVGAGDRVAIMLSNTGSAEAHVAYHAVHQLGAINVPINTLYVERELAYAMGFITPAAIIFAPEFRPLVQIAQTILSAPAALLEVTAEPQLGEPLGRLLDKASDDPAPTELEETDDADWIFTSGTTGHPKAVALTHANSVACGYEARSLWELDATSVYQNPAPFFTSTGCHTNQLACLAAQCTNVIDPAPDLEAMLGRARRLGTSSMFLLTPLVAMLFRRLDDGRLAELDVGSLKRLAYGGQVMPRAFHERVEREFEHERGVGLGTVYGLTEGGTSGLFFGPEDHAEAVRRCGSYGLSIGRRTWNDWIEYRIVAEDGSEAEPGRIGEIYLRAPSVMSRYVNNPEATARALEGGWLHTGDMASVDDAGLVYFVDRSKQMIRRGGMNISSTEVEAVLLAHPAVAEVAVIARPNPVLGEDPHAIVALEPATEGSEAELIEFCRGKLADYKIPRSVSFVDALPRNAMGRVVRTELAPHVPQARSQD